MNIANIRIALYLHHPRLYYHASPPTKTSPLMTPTCSNIYSCGGTYSTITPPTLLPIAGTPGDAAAAAGTEYVGVSAPINPTKFQRPFVSFD